jgi:hypothetical protein
MVKNRRKYEETVVVNNSATIVKQKQTMYMQALEILHTTYASLVLLVLCKSIIQSSSWQLIPCSKYNVYYMYKYFQLNKYNTFEHLGEFV